MNRLNWTVLATELHALLEERAKERWPGLDVAIFVHLSQEAGSVRVFGRLSAQIERGVLLHVPEFRANGPREFEEGFETASKTLWARISEEYAAAVEAGWAR